MDNTNEIVQKEISDKIMGAAGLALRARKCIVGTNLCVAYIRADKGNLLIVANDVSDNSREKLIKAAEIHKIPYLTVDKDKAELAELAGKKSDTAALLITDSGFVRIIEKLGIEIHKTNTEVLN